MKPRNREINIFNMSLLDVLCGALGAFCFMMLVLFPSYKQNPQSSPPPGPPPQNCEECMQQHQSMQKRAEELNARNTQLEMRNPFVVEMIPRFGGFDIDMYLHDDRQAGDGSKSAPPDIKVSQDTKFSSDRYIGGRGQYPEVWMVRDAPAAAYRVYYKVMAYSVGTTAAPNLVEGRFVSEKLSVYFPQVAVRKVGDVFHVATITSDGQGNFTVKPEMAATEPEKLYAEREEWFRAEKARQDEELRKQEADKKQAPEQKKDEQKKQ